MNDNSLNSIAKLISELRNFSEQISLLLKSSDYIFQKRNWAILNSDITLDSSKLIDYPLKWFPEFFCRFYKNQDYANVQFYIAVILDNRNSNKSYDFGEPIITCGYFWGLNNPEKVDLWRCRWHVYSDNKNYKGVICELDPMQKKWSSSESDFIHLKSLALPLTEITSSNVLQKSIIEPLFDKLDQELKTSS